MGLLFGKGHLSTLGASRDSVFLFLLSAKRWGSSSVYMSQSRKMTLSKDKFDAVRRNPYSLNGSSAVFLNTFQPFLFPVA